VDVVEAKVKVKEARSTHPSRESTRAPAATPRNRAGGCGRSESQRSPKHAVESSNVHPPQRPLDPKKEKENQGKKIKKE
jgi:hypothetical protein